MSRSLMTPVIYVLIGLAIVGVALGLINDTMGFLMNILIMIGIAAVFYFIITHFVLKNRGGSSNEMKKYKQAVKQSKAKYKSTSTEPKRMAKPSFQPATLSGKKRKKAAQATHLRVIEGHKNKKKNRASF
ncbi:SA1362 family protein [Thalassobacillus hwangdonensis]|uniref:SA1362 family protein n=1 Tax=Thalassobacillus hwangdonensis TaxID=546108 RepID=A0ABW3L124_9BACI